MSIPQIAAWAVVAGAFVALTIVVHRGGSAILQANLVLVTSAALVFGITNQWMALALYGVSILLVLGTWRLGKTRAWWAWIVLIMLVLIGSKLPTTLGANTNGAAETAVVWLGFSYLAFRLIHITVESHAGRIRAITLRETLIYALHPASLLSGPIDRIQKSAVSQREPATLEDVHQGLWRIIGGAVLKFVIANPLFSFISVNDMARNPDRPTYVAWIWLIAYSFYLLADFSAYTSIAIGFGRVAGLILPENFHRPYLAPSISVFWQRWHITLSTWVRDYIFFPLARSLRTRLGNRGRAGIQFVCHLATMGAVGLWHGLNPGFLIWGLWHGLGLFVHGQLAPHLPRAGSSHPFVAGFRTLLSIGATYFFVMLGWVFFASDLPTALRIFARLFGVG